MTAAGAGSSSRAPRKDSETRKGIIDLTTGNRLSAVWLKKTADASWATSDREAFAAYLTAWIKTDFADKVKGNKTAMLLVVGQHNPALGEDTIKQTFKQWHPNAQIGVMANAGHYAMDETPVALATSIERFLAG